MFFNIFQNFSTFLNIFKFRFSFTNLHFITRSAQQMLSTRLHFDNSNNVFHWKRTKQEFLFLVIITTPPSLPPFSSFEGRKNARKFNLSWYFCLPKALKSKLISERKQQKKKLQKINIQIKSFFFFLFVCLWWISQLWGVFVVETKNFCVFVTFWSCQKLFQEKKAFHLKKNEAFYWF